MLISALALSLLIQTSGQAPDGPVGLVSGDARLSSWTNAPVETAPGVKRIWWWNLTSPPDRLDGLNRMAFQYEVHCEAGQLRQTRFELWADDRLIRGHDQNQPLHAPVGAWADSAVAARACGLSSAEVTAPNLGAAAAHFR